MSTENLCNVLNALIKKKIQARCVKDNMYNNLVELQKVFQGKIMNMKQVATMSAAESRRRREVNESQLENSKSELLKLANVLDNLEEKQAGVVDRFSRAEQVVQEIDKRIRSETNLEITKECKIQTTIQNLQEQDDVFETKLRFCKLSMEEEYKRRLIVEMKLRSFIVSFKEVEKQANENQNKLEILDEALCIISNKIDNIELFCEQQIQRKSFKDQMISMFKSLKQTEKFVDCRLKMAKLKEEMRDVKRQMECIQLIIKEKVIQKQEALESLTQSFARLCEEVKTCAEYSKGMILNIEEQLHLIVNKVEELLLELSNGLNQ